MVARVDDLGGSVLVVADDGDIAEPAGKVEVEDGAQQPCLCPVAVIEVVVVALLGGVAYDRLPRLVEKLVGGTDARVVRGPELLGEGMAQRRIAVGEHTVVIMHVPEGKRIVGHAVARGSEELPVGVALEGVRKLLTSSLKKA